MNEENTLCDLRSTGKPSNVLIVRFCDMMHRLISRTLEKVGCFPPGVAAKQSSHRVLCKHRMTSPQRPKKINLHVPDRAHVKVIS